MYLINITALMIMRVAFKLQITAALRQAHRAVEQPVLQTIIVTCRLQTTF